jgi:hypothetical protein
MSNEFGKMPPRPWQDRRYGECVHGNGMAVCQECKNKRNPILKAIKADEEIELEEPIKLPNGAVMTPAGLAEMGGKQFGGCPKCHRVGCPGAPRFKGICDAAENCDRSDPERCVLQEHYHGVEHLEKVLEELMKNSPIDPRITYRTLNIEKFCKDCGGLNYQWLGMDGQPPGMDRCHCDDSCAAYTPDERELPKYTGYLDIDAFLDDCLETMRVKGHDYRQGNDADLLHNFRTVGNTVGVDMMKVWFTYFYKHYSAMATFIKEGGQSESEPIEGRIKDQIVYLLLFYRMVQEKKTPPMHHPV